MKTVRVKEYIDGVESIYAEKPKYEEGYDGTDGKCDCIGMCRGGLKRAGATGVTNMRGTNQAARKAIQRLAIIDYVKNLRVGDVVLRTRDKDDPDMPLPDKYRKGGSEYDPVVGETNFTHIGTITCMNPLEITHMTSPTAKKDKSLKGWSYYGRLPWVNYDNEPEPEPTPEPTTQYATVVSENGKPVKMRAKPSTKCSLYWEVPNGSEVIILEWEDSWCHIQWAGQKGYMMSCFLRPTGGSDLYTVIVPHLTIYQAEALLATYPGSHMEVERG